MSTYIKNISLSLLFVSALFSCSKLDEDLNGELTEEEAQELLGSSGGTTDVTALLRSTYLDLRPAFVGQNNYFALQQHTTDETMGPTRGGDWDDGGVWRVLHSHQWDANHPYFVNIFRNILRISFSATDILRFNPTPAQAAEARFYRAITDLAVVDGWDQVPYRENTADPTEVPKVRVGSDALNYIISEVEAIIPNLPDNGPAYQVGKNAARVLLMKAYMMKGVIANRATPTFDAADMNKVITLADQIIATNKYSLTPQYFDNFAPTNDQLSTENIFTLAYREPAVPGSTNLDGPMFIYHQSLHYNSPVGNGGGWNGFVTLSDFYDKFGANDTRRGIAYPGVTDVTGLRVGMLLGQQFGPGGAILKDRKGNNLEFRRDVSLLETDPVAIELNGIRVVKYVPDLVEEFPSRHDWVIYRFADVLLMKAEALLRTNRAGEALTLVNQVRARSNAGALGTLTLDIMLDELGREFYWEGHRRTDLLRFGKYLQAWQGKAASGPERLRFPIPNRALAANPNLVQNEGY